MSIEHLRVPVKGSFDHRKSEHVKRLLASLQAEGHGEGWQVQSYDSTNATVTFSRRRLLTHVGQNTSNGSYKVELGTGTKPSDGKKIAAELESDPEHAGFFMTEFDPFLSQAVLGKLTDDERRCRSAVAAAMGINSWDVQVEHRLDGGFFLKLPSSYIPSKHDLRIQEVAESVVGRLGWFWSPDPANLAGVIVPADPPTFPKTIDYPFELLPKKNLHRVDPIPLGLRLAERGDQDNELLFLDFEAAPHVQLGGTTGSGKSIVLSNIIAGSLASGAELAIIDLPQKAIDFEGWRPFVRPGGWGCESLEEAAVVLRNLYEEGEARARVLKKHKVKKVSLLPLEIRKSYPDVVIVVDEVTGLFLKDFVPKLADSDDPLVVQAQSNNNEKELIKVFIEKIAAEQRFVGYHLVLSTQVASINTGVSTALRTNLPHKILLGSKATKSNRELILLNPDQTPKVPEHISNDPGASAGVGVAELAGQKECCFKSFYAEEKQLIQALHHIQSKNNHTI